MEEAPKVSPYLRAYTYGPIHKISPKFGRNFLCPITNKKFKHCCGADGSKFCKEHIEKVLEVYKSKLESEKESS